MVSLKHEDRYSHDQQQYLSVPKTSTKKRIYTRMEFASVFTSIHYA